MTLNEAISLPSLRQKLEEGGYTSLEQLLTNSVKEIAEELELNFEELKQLIDLCDKERGIKKRTLQELIDVEIKNSISTSSKNINALFEHGVPPRKITEICGESGSGKTQLCTQLAVNVQLLRKQGGIEGECIYIDTEGSFLTSRFIEVANGHDVDQLLKGLHYFRVLDHTEFMALMRQLPKIIRSYPKVKLIIIDSIAYHFRLNVLDAKTRTAILHFIAHSLVDIARANDVSVVVSNHVTQEGTDAAWTPSLGTSWGSWCANRLFIFRKRHFRYALLYKSFDTRKSEPVQFCIKTEGITDPEEDEIEVKQLISETQAEIHNEIDTAWVQLKEKHLDEKELEKVDDFWNEACLADEFLSQLPPEMQLPITKMEETVPATGELQNDILYPNVEEEDIPCTQVELTEDPGLFESHFFTGTSSSILSSEEDTATENITPITSAIFNHIPNSRVRKSIDISDMPPDLSSSFPKRRKRTHNDDDQHSAPILIPDDGHANSGLLSSRDIAASPTTTKSQHHHSSKKANINSSQHKLPEKEEGYQVTENVNSSKSIVSDDADWDSDLEEQLDYAFLDEINYLL